MSLFWWRCRLCVRTCCPRSELTGWRYQRERHLINSSQNGVIPNLWFVFCELTLFSKVNLMNWFMSSWCWGNMGSDFFVLHICGKLKLQEIELCCSVSLSHITERINTARSVYVTRFVVRHLRGVFSVWAFSARISVKHVCNTFQERTLWFGSKWVSSCVYRRARVRVCLLTLVVSHGSRPLTCFSCPSAGRGEPGRDNNLHPASPDIRRLLQGFYTIPATIQGNVQKASDRVILTIISIPAPFISTIVYQLMLFFYIIFLSSWHVTIVYM